MAKGIGVAELALGRVGRVPGPPSGHSVLAGLAGVAGVAFGAIVVKNILNTAEAISKVDTQAIKLGGSIEDLSKLRDGLAQAGIGAEEARRSDLAARRDRINSRSSGSTRRLRTRRKTSRRVGRQAPNNCGILEKAADRSGRRASGRATSRRTWGDRLRITSRPHLRAWSMGGRCRKGHMSCCLGNGTYGHVGRESPAGGNGA